MGKEEKMRRISCFLLMLTLLLTTTVVAWGTVPTDGEVTPSLVNVSRSKTATVLDKDYRSTVTLSLPSAEEKLASDVVFVLDKSTSAELEDKDFTNRLNMCSQWEANVCAPPCS